jgi:hypothetical protein
LRDCNQMEFPFHGQSAGDSPAKTSAPQGKGKESSENSRVSGRRCFDSSEMYGQRGQLLKMYQPFDLRGLPWSFKISARSGISLNGIAYPLVPLALLTVGTASGSWRTPHASCWKNASTMGERVGGGHTVNLQDQVRHWPTPCNNPRPNEGNVRILRAKVISGELTREEAAGMLMGKDPFESQGVVPAHYSEGSVKPITGKLNPTWVEWLMGFPAGWTDLSN